MTINTANPEPEPVPFLLLLPLGETLRRIPQVLLGLVFFGVGIAFMVNGDLGLGPWDVFHKAVAARTGLSIGTVIIGTGLLVVLLFVPLREQLGLGTILNAFVIGLSADAALSVLEAPSAFAGRLAFTLAGPVVIALGSGLYIGGGLGPGPRDGVMTGLSKRGIAVWKARTGIEMTVLAVGLLLGGSVGIGTIWFTFGIGPMVQWFLPRLER